MLHPSYDNSVVENVKNPFFQIVPSLRSLRICSCPSYKGVFCLYGKYDNYFKIILWNPSTREVKAIPPPPSLPNYHLYQHSSSYLFLYCGFGGNPITNDLMIINLAIDDRGPRHDIYYSAEVYNLRTSSWTKICGPRHDFIVDHFTKPPRFHIIKTSTVLANGICYWLLGEETQQQKCILCFHFCNKRFSKLKLPKLPSIHLKHGFITDINDSMAYVVGCKRSRGQIHIWTFEPDTNRWSKKYNFGPIDWRVLQWPFQMVTFSKDGAEFFALAKYDGIWQMVSYNSHCMSISTFEFNLEGSCFLICYNRKYVESIVPLSFSSSR
ncbi:putative kelch-type beta propeller, F-box associated interaction domain-containing protein [Lupinus albus]|uniref:Putative kelch-type beta propeller, F-box associated interaction domain-containing protein n=1 Tax=Lupinus albus TaxID=3870 RepID=A0A6A4NGV1_LUPAL|nr:putative kelch-type beta propeller, F-box associated interaction domain-containing protein [Lupinus albus]